MKTALIILLSSLLTLMGSCVRHTGPQISHEPHRTGDRISFPEGAPQLGALDVEWVTGQHPESARLFGRLAWDEDVTVRVFTPFAGRVRRVLVDVGQAVRRGAPLAEVESPDFGQAQSDARAAESARRLAESNLARLRELYDHGAVPLKDVDAAEAEATRAAAESARSRARLAVYGAGADSVDGVFVLRSPMAGTIVQRNVTPGQEIRPDQMLANAPQLCAPLFVTSDPTRLWIEIDARETELDGLRPGTSFSFETAALPGRRFGGRLDVVSESIDPVTHTVQARGTIANPDRTLKAEMFVTVETPRSPVAGVSLPASAVFLKGERHYVFVEERPGTFVRRAVDVSDESDSRVLVSAGVQRGERVVTEGCVLLEQLLD
jgi:cobalt-zinc-cadmium efflux system membrane fusion protein